MARSAIKRKVTDPLYRGPIHPEEKKKYKRIDCFKPGNVDNRQFNGDMLVYYNIKPYHLIMKYVKDEIMEHTKYVTGIKYLAKYPDFGKLYFTLRKGRRKVKIMNGRKVVPSPTKQNRTLPCYNIYVSNVLKAQELSQEKVIAWINDFLEDLYQ